MNKHIEIIKIVIIYALFGSAWIYLSDTFLGHYTQDDTIITKLAISKGLLFILFTSVLLYLLIARLSTRIDHSTQALRQSEERQRLLLKNSSDCLAIVDAEGIFQFISPAVTKISGFSTDELQGTSLDTIIHPDDLKETMAAWNEAILHPEKTITIRYRQIHKSGEVVFLEAVTQSFLNEPAINGVIASVRDITERMQNENALRRTNETLSQFIKHSPIYAFIKEVGPTESRTLYASENYRDMIGIPGSEMVGMTMEELFPADLAAKITADDQTVVSNGRILHLDEDLHDRNYTTIKFPIVLGEKHLLAGYTIDITARKQAEMALQRSRMLLEITERLTNVGGWEWDVKKQQMTWTAGTYRLHGFTPDEFPPESSELIQRSIACYAPEAREKILTAFERCATEGHAYDFECGFTTADGRPRHIRTTGYAVRDESGQIRHVVGTFRDITEEKEAEAQLRLQALVLNQISDLVTVTDLNGKVTYVNDAVTKELGYSREDLIGAPVKKYCKDPTDEATQRQIREKTLHNGRWQSEVISQTADGRAINLACRTQIVFDELGKKIAICGIATDITARKREELEKEKLQAQLTQAQKLESVGRLAGGVAHDFNNMLSVILGYSGLALEQMEPDQPIYIALQEIKQAAQRSADLTRQLLAFARKQTVTPQVLNLNETVKSMLNMLRRLIGENIELVWLPGENPGQIKMDPSQIDQILANLCVNARDAIGDTGKITITTSNVLADAAYCAGRNGFLPGEYVLLTVSDTGCGMDSEMQEHLFEPFFTTKEVGKGTGLGLATVYGVIKQNNGYIEITSVPGQGSTFAMYLPRYMAKADRMQVPEAVQPVVYGHETILLVEDESMILTMVSEMLKSLGYNVLPAATPGEALRLAQDYAGEIHLLMTDVVMPEMNGRDLAKKLLTLYPDIKRLFMSGYTADVIAHHGVLDEGVHFIQKPFTMKDLTAKIKNVLMT